MEVKKECINFMEQCVKLSTNVCVEGDVIVPDTKPDIREILLADANAITQSCEYRNGKLFVSGTVFFKILYRPDAERDQGEMKSLSTSFGFSDSVDIPSGEELLFHVNAATEHIGFTLVNSRKLSAKVIVSLGICGECSKTFAPVTDISDQEIPCRKKTYEMEMPMGEARSCFKVTDFLTIPADMPDIEEILKMDVWASDATCKKMSGKGMLSGTLHVKTLYIGANEDCTTQVVSHEIPFTEIMEAEGLDEDCAVCMTFSVQDALYSVRGDMNGDTKIINAEILVCAELGYSKTMQQTMVDDCYGICGEVNCTYENFCVDRPVAKEQTTFLQTQVVPMEKKATLQEVVHVTCKPIMREACVEADGVHVRGTLVSFLLYREEGDDQPIKSAVTETDFDWKKQVDTKGNLVDCKLWLEDVQATRNNSEEAEVTVALGLNLTVCDRQNVAVVTNCALSPDESNGEKHPRLILYFAEEGDTLWGIAKRYGTTMEKIKDANNLQTDRFVGGERLLIPKAG